MVDIIPPTRFTEDELPIIDSADIDGVSVYGYVGNMRDVFDHTDEPTVEFSSEFDGQLFWEFYPFGGDNDVTFTLTFFDGNGNYLGEFESPTCGWDGGCELAIEFEYDFSGSTNVLSTSGNTPSRSDVTFDTDDVLVSYTLDEVPEDWVDLVGSPMLVTFTEYPSGTHCEGEELSYTVDVHNSTLQPNTFDIGFFVMDDPADDEEEQDFSWAIEKVREIGGSDGIELDVDETVEISGSFNIQRYINEYDPDEIDNHDIPHLYSSVDGASSINEVPDDTEINVYEHSSSDISIDNVSYDGEVFVGEDYEVVASISNTSECQTEVNIYISEVTISIGGDDTEDETFTLVEDQDIEGGETIEVEYSATAPDSSGVQDYMLEVESSYDGNRFASESFAIDYIGESDVISIEDISIDGSLISDRDVDVTVNVKNNSDSSVSVDIHSGGNEVASYDVRSNDDRDISFTYTLPEVDESTEHSIEVEAHTSEGVADTITDVVDVEPVVSALSIDRVTLPSSADSGETIGSRDATVRVDSEIDDVDVSIDKDDSTLTTHTFSRSGTEDIGIEFDVPEVDETQDVELEFYLVSDDVIADSSTETITVTGPSDYFSIDYMDVPSEMLSGEVQDISVGVSNDSDDTETVRIQYDGDTVVRDDVRRERSSELSFEFQAPDVDSSETVTVDVDMVVGGNVVDSESENVDVTNVGESINIEDIEVPDSVYGGENVEVGVSVNNESSDRVEVDLEYDDSIVDTNTVRSGRSRTLSFEYSAPEVEESVFNDIEVLISVDGDIVDSGSTTLTVEPPELSISSISAPSSICSGSTLQMDIDVSNDTDVDRDCFLTVVGGDIETAEYDVDSVSPRRDTTVDVEFDIPYGVTESSVSFDFVLEYDGDSVVEVDSDSINISIDKPDVQIDSIDIPEKASPGEVDGTVEARNIGPCDTDVDIIVSGESNETTLRSNESSSADITFNLGTEQTVFDIEIVDDITGDTYAVESHTVTPINYLNVNTDTGDVHIVNDYDASLEIDGQVAGQNVEISGNVRREFDVLPNIAGSSFSGRVQPSESAERIIRSDNLRFLNVGVNEDMTWVVDGDVKGTSRSFRHSEGSTDNFIPEDELDPRRVRTESRGKLGSNIGIVRTILGLR